MKCNTVGCDKPVVMQGLCEAHAPGAYGKASLEQYTQAAHAQHIAVQGLGDYGQTAMAQAQMRPVEPQPHPRLAGLVERMTRLLRHRETFLTYMRERMEDHDMHACSDAANDLRELDCEIRCVEEMIELVGGKVT